jgi:hypothetical protein
MTKSAFRFLSVCALCLLGSGPALAAPVAYVHELSGTLQARYGKRAPQGLRVGGTIEPGATLSTGAGSKAVVKFEDGQIVALQPDTQFIVRDYRFVKTNVARSNSFLELLTGGLRFVTGMIGATNKNAFKLTAGTATIGIRGTDGTLLFNPTTGDVSAATNLGALMVSTPLGTSNIPTGSFVTAARNAPPPPSAPITQAPPAVAQVIAQARAVAMPVNTPVSVPTSARAAATQAQADAADAAVQAATTTEARLAAAQAAEQARAEAAAAAQAATQASEQATQAAIQAGAVLPAPPAPPVAAPPTAPDATPAAPSSEAPATTEPSTVTTVIESLPSTAAGETEPAVTSTPTAPAVTTTPTATGSGSGGGGTASVR